MLNYQRDIGAFQGNTPSVKMIELSNRGQVFTVTHDGEGNPLSAIEKSFISFSWGGKNIEDFSLIVVNDGSRYNDKIYSDFQDLITDYEIVDGQNYWGTSFSAGTKEFQLATDGMTEKDFQAFRNWFRPGIMRELILAEKPNRGIYARIAAAPQYSLLPFEHTETIILNDSERKVSSTIWKGSITIDFIFDEPFWYSKEGFFDKAGQNLTSMELRSIVEDGIPSKEMLIDSCLLANNYYYDGENYQFNEGVVLSNNIVQYLYYCGTAKSKPIISFDLAPSINNTGFINLPLNKYAAHAQTNETFSALFIENQNNERQIFKFTTPGILSAYNQVISMIINDFHVGDSIIELKNAFKETITNFYIRTWAVGLCDMALNNKITNICDANSMLKNDWNNKFKNYIRQVFSTSNFICQYVFDSEGGQATMRLGVYILDPSGNITDGRLPISDEIVIEENVGDMVRSEYIILEERTLPNENNLITHNECLKLSANCTLTNFKIDYKYMYL